VRTRDSANLPDPESAVTLSLEEATRRLGSTIVSAIKKQAIIESQEGKNLPRTLDSKAFAYLVDHITKFAISKISAE